MGPVCQRRPGSELSNLVSTPHPWEQGSRHPPTRVVSEEAECRVRAFPSRLPHDSEGHVGAVLRCSCHSRSGSCWWRTSGALALISSPSWGQQRHVGREG